MITSPFPRSIRPAQAPMPDPFPPPEQGPQADDLRRPPPEGDEETSGGRAFPRDTLAASPATRAERPSKTRRKQASHQLQDLGEAVIALPDERLAALDLPESLLDAIADYKHTKTFEGQRRQMQYIGKLMRRIDPEPIRQAVTEMQLGRAHDSLALHRAEAWRSQLVADDAALTRFSAEHPAADVQQLRTLVRNARKDAALTPEQRNGRAYRELFRFIRQHVGADAS